MLIFQNVIMQQINTNLKNMQFDIYLQNIFCIQWKLRLKKLDLNIICPTWANMQSSFEKWVGVAAGQLYRKYVSVYPL